MRMAVPFCQSHNKFASFHNNSNICAGTMCTNVSSYDRVANAEPRRNNFFSQNIMHQYKISNWLSYQFRQRYVCMYIIHTLDFLVKKSIKWQVCLNFALNGIRFDSHDFIVHEQAKYMWVLNRFQQIVVNLIVIENFSFCFYIVRSKVSRFCLL